MASKYSEHCKPSKVWPSKFKYFLFVLSSAGEHFAVSWLSFTKANLKPYNKTCDKIQPTNFIQYAEQSIFKIFGLCQNNPHDMKIWFYQRSINTVKNIKKLTFRALAFRQSELHDRWNKNSQIKTIDFRRLVSFIDRTSFHWHIWRGQ